MMDKQLKYLREAWKEIDELFKAHTYQWIGDEKIKFTIGDYLYRADLEDMDDNNYYIDFGIIKDGHYDTKTTLNSVDATDVLSTIFKAVVEKSDKESELRIFFSPTKDGDEKGSESKRFSFYKRFAERLAKQPDFPFNFGKVYSEDEDDDNFVFLFTPKLEENDHYSAKTDRVSSMSPNRLTSFVPFARIGRENKSLVAENPSGGFYGYDTIERAIEQIKRAKNLEGWQAAKSFFIAQMSGEETLYYFDENGVEV